jgi:hypothetical protein
MHYRQFRSRVCDSLAVSIGPDSARDIDSHGVWMSASRIAARSPNARRPGGRGTELEGWGQVHRYPSLAVMASVLHGLAGMGSSAAGCQFACCHAPCFAKRARVAANGDGSLDAGEDLYRTATVGANTHIDSKHALETSRPGHQAALLHGVGGSPFALKSIDGSWVAGRAPRLGAALTVHGSSRKSPASLRGFCFWIIPKRRRPLPAAARHASGCRT